jgi:hypothetical protein
MADMFGRLSDAYLAGWWYNHRYSLMRMSELGIPKMGLHVNCPLFLLRCNNIQKVSLKFLKTTSIRFYNNLFWGFPVVTDVQMDRQIDDDGDGDDRRIFATFSYQRILK